MKRLRTIIIAVVVLAAFPSNAADGVVYRVGISGTIDLGLYPLIPRAISAGVLIALTCEQIFVSPGATIGATTPVHGGDFFTSVKSSFLVFSKLPDSKLQTSTMIMLVTPSAGSIPGSLRKT